MSDVEDIGAQSCEGRTEQISVVGQKMEREQERGEERKGVEKEERGGGL